MSDRTTYESEARAVQRDARPTIRSGQARSAAPTTGERLTRKRRIDNPLYFDKRIIPQGYAYEWKRLHGVSGKPEPAHAIALRENHWRPVPADRHPELAIAGETEINRGDVTLCERPAYLSDEARMDDMQDALDPVQRMEETIFGDRKPGTFDRDKRVTSVRQQWAPGDPVEDQGGGQRGEGLSAEP